MAPGTVFSTPNNYVRTKPGVTFTPLAPGGIKILWALVEASRVLKLDLLITAGSNGHTAPSRHVTGEAMDISVAGLSPDAILALRMSLMNLLGTDHFYVQFEAPSLVGLDSRLTPVTVPNPEATGPHIHVQVRKSVVYPPVPTPLTSRA